jgi:hypothetical protein
MPERDEQYVDQWANARIIGTTRYHCTDGEMSYRDKEGGEHGSEDECAELNRRLRSGIGAGSNPNLR